MLLERQRHRFRERQRRRPRQPGAHAGVGGGALPQFRAAWTANNFGSGYGAYVFTFQDNTTISSEFLVPLGQAASAANLVNVTVDGNTYKVYIYVLPGGTEFTIWAAGTPHNWHDLGEGETHHAGVDQNTFIDARIYDVTIAAYT